LLGYEWLKFLRCKVSIVTEIVERREAELIKYIENLILTNRNNALDEY